MCYKMNIMLIEFLNFGADQRSLNRCQCMESKKNTPTTFNIFSIFSSKARLPHLQPIHIGRDICSS